MFSDIIGVMHEAECLKLHELANASKHPIVNIGVYQGLSTAHLASGTKQNVYAIDIWNKQPAGFTPSERYLLRGYHLKKTLWVTKRGKNEH